MKIKEINTYKNLAWTDTIIAPPEVYYEETNELCKKINAHSQSKIKTILHMGCGAGGNDHTFKKQFEVTGVDISAEMLEIARKVNPEITYVQGDMRTFKLENTFDAVVIPDSIDHMVTPKDIKNTISNAYRHLKPGGLLFIIANIKEEFQENNFVYTGKKGDMEITIFENNYIPKENDSTYESTIIHLIRNKGKLEVYNETITLGLFDLNTWLKLFNNVGFILFHEPACDSYKDYLMEGGEYPQTLFIGQKGQ